MSINEVVKYVREGLSKAELEVLACKTKEEMDILVQNIGLHIKTMGA